MLLTISTTRAPATDLGYLLHKHPGKLQSFEQSFGWARVFYPEATDDRCTASLLLDIDPIALVRGRSGPAGEGRVLEQYVNDRPYVASSFMSVAIARVFGSAMKGTCADRPGVVDEALPLEATLAVVPARGGGEDLIRKLFEPLGYEVVLVRHVLDAKFPQWGEGPYFTVTLRHQIPLKTLLTHLYVLIPVLDNDKHYWIGQDELEKLLKHGEGWLKDHAHRELITTRYLRHFKSLTREALARLADEDEPDPDAAAADHDREEDAIERPMSLHEQRHATVLAALKAGGATSVVDIGCAQGRLLRRLLDEPQFTNIAGVDVSLRALDEAEERLKLDRMPPRQRERIKLHHGSMLYRDKRLNGFDAACLVEVIEHLDPPRLAAMQRVVFEFAHPRLVIVTTPNVEYNVRFETLPAGELRHQDHRFEWTRGQFQVWANETAERFGYTVRFLSIGPDDPEVGSPTQMAVFTTATP